MASQPCSGARWRVRRLAAHRHRELLLASARLYEARRDPDHKPPNSYDYLPIVWARMIVCPLIGRPLSDRLVHDRF